MTHPSGSCIWRFFAPGGRFVDAAGHTAAEAFREGRCYAKLGIDFGELAEEPAVLQGPVQRRPAVLRLKRRRLPVVIIGREHGSVRP